jgi:hypothetical protein
MIVGDGGSIRDFNTNGQIYLSGNLHIDSYNGNEIYLNYWSGALVRAQGILQAYGDMRAPVFYESTNTGRYVDPGALSELGHAAFTRGAASMTSVEPAVEVRSSNNATAAQMAFHRPGAYAVLFGLDNDNVMKLGGWSAGAEMHKWDLGGNQWSKGAITAAYFADFQDTSYYLDPANFSRCKSYRADTNAYASNPGTGVDSFGFWTYGPFGGGIGMSDGAGDFAFWLTGGINRELKMGFGANLGTLAEAGKMSSATFEFYGDIRSGVFYDRDDTNAYFATDSVRMRGTSPTVYMRDTDGHSAFPHVNSNVFYILGSTANDAATWNQPNGHWPLEIQLANNNAKFGAALSCVGALTQNTSDERLKKNFRPIQNPIDAMRALHGWVYDWNLELCHEVSYYPEAGFETDDIGLKAQEVQKWFPQAVAIAPFDQVKDHDGIGSKSKSGEDYLTVKYEKLVPALFAICNEQQDQIEHLTKLVNKILKEK